MSAQGTDNGVWGGANITEAALEIQSAISSPTCQTTETCIDFVRTEIPQCLEVNGAASCWCSPDSPLLACAECMAHPTDASTTFQQTEAATKGILAYGAGCQAYAAYLSGSTTLSSAAATASSASPIPTIPSPAHPSTGLSSGAISGIVSGSVSFVSLCIFVGYVWYKQSENRRRIAPVAPVVVQRPEAPANQEFVGPIRVMTHASGTRIDLSGGPDLAPGPRRPPGPRRLSRASDQQV
ncbi:hypothetical protein M407DRAFT_25499 [Tulasnella calospora MUT 4182]|uniref:Uncharacterized protein n=1 Tax=Tulasnella calospora MUT 4182 TaxID=1051891 RepID=A0A0C3QHF3_9AGAM|nr:hypothetical protein M407DRAFT_25499 [Tulasnella calospora MUT 4182]